MKISSAHIHLISVILTSVLYWLAILLIDHNQHPMKNHDRKILRYDGNINYRFSNIYGESFVKMMNPIGNVYKIALSLNR